MTSYTIDTRRLNPGMWSRYTHAVPSSSLEGETLVQTLANYRTGSEAYRARTGATVHGAGRSANDVLTGASRELLIGTDALT